MYTSIEIRRQKNKCTFCQATFKPTDLMEIEHIKSKSEGVENTYKNKQLLMICWYWGRDIPMTRNVGVGELSYDWSS